MRESGEPMELGIFDFSRCFQGLLVSTSKIRVKCTLGLFIGFSDNLSYIKFVKSIKYNEELIHPYD